MKRCTWLAMVALGLCAASALARQGTVRTKDGRSIEGDVADKGDQGVVITTKAGTVGIAREDISAVDYAADINEAYKARLAGLPKDAGVREHMDIARWLYDQKAYDLARKELDFVQRIDPNNSDASILRQTIDHQAILDRTRTAPEDHPHAADAGPTGRPIKPGDRKLLNADQINTVRQNEMRETESRVRVRFENNVNRRFVEYDSQDPKVFASKSPFTKAVEILQRGTAEMRRDVRILTDPQSLADYKTRVQPIILNGCAAVACHGGTKAGNLVLYSPADNDAITYTNFLILNRYSTTVGSGEQSVERKAIDRVYPINSLILQYGLPRQTAEFRHPELPIAMTPVFRGSDDPRFRLIREWIASDLITRAPDYQQIFKDFELPMGNRPATRPAAPPAAQTPPPPAPGTRTADTTPPRQQRPANNGNDDTRNKLDEIRQKMRPTGGASSVPSPF